MIHTLTNTTLDSLVVDPSLVEHLENGAILYLPNLPFTLLASEQDLLSADIMPLKAKNISYDPRNQTLKAFEPHHAHYVKLTAMLQRYSEFAAKLLAKTVPHYTQALAIARTSYRPVEIAGRMAKSYRKDDSRLHIDAFPASPNQGQQLLRVFSNVHPHHQPRVWRVGEAFPEVVKHFKNNLRLPLPFVNPLLHALHITRTLRTPYDSLMLQLHDVMKADSQYQDHVAQQCLELTGSWIVFTDQVSHAAMRGQYCLEQTFMLPSCARKNPDASPLHVLQRQMGRALV